MGFSCFKYLYIFFISVHTENKNNRIIITDPTTYILLLYIFIYLFRLLCYHVTE